MNEQLVAELWDRFVLCDAEDIAAMPLETITAQIHELRTEEPDDLDLTDGEIAGLLLDTALRAMGVAELDPGNQVPFTPLAQYCHLRLRDLFANVLTPGEIDRGLIVQIALRELLMARLALERNDA